MASSPPVIPRRPGTLADNPRLRLLTLCLLYLAQGLPFGFVTITLAGYLAANDFGAKQVAEVIFVAQFPWTFKFLWGPLIDRFSFPSLNLGTWLSGSLAGVIPYATLFFFAGGFQGFLILILRFIDPGETRRLLGDGMVSK